MEPFMFSNSADADRFVAGPEMWSLDGGKTWRRGRPGRYGVRFPKSAGRVMEVTGVYVKNGVVTVTVR